MINRHIIDVTLRDHNINKVYARGNEDSYHDEYLSSFYITRLHIKRYNIAYKLNHKNRITSSLDECFETNEYSQLPEIDAYLKKTIHYIAVLKTKIESLPENIESLSSKYLPLIETKKINGMVEIFELKEIAGNILDKIKSSGYFEKTEYYKKVLSSIRILIDEIKNDPTNIEKINVLKSKYQENEIYLKGYLADISPITDEIDIASQHLNKLFQNIREIGIVTCEADQFIDNKKNNIDNEKNYEITPIHDIKYKNLYIFKDSSILFEYMNGDFLEIQDNEHLGKIQNEIMFNSVGIEFKKKPTIEKVFKTAIVKKPDYINRIIGIAAQYKKYSHILKDKKIKVLDEMKNYTQTKLGYEGLEEISDKIQKIAKAHNVKVFAYSIASQKYKNLYDNKVMDIMELLYDLKIEKEILQEQIGSKIAAYKTPEDFYTGLKKLYGVLSNFTKDLILEKVSKNNTKITYENDDIIILEIKRFEESALFGAPSWCISRDITYYTSYTNGSKQYIVYNFKPETETKKTLIGITLNDNLIKAANYKNNDNIKRTDITLISLIDLIKKAEMKEDM